jgi:hypothetical protein
MKTPIEKLSELTTLAICDITRPVSEMVILLRYIVIQQDFQIKDLRREIDRLDRAIKSRSVTKVKVTNL